MFILFLPMTQILNIFGYFPISLMVIIFAFLKRRNISIRFYNTYLICVIFVLLYHLFLIYKGNDILQLLRWLLTFFVYFYMVRVLLVKMPIALIAKYIAYSLIVLSTFSLLDFFLQVLLNLDLTENYINYGNRPESTGGFKGLPRSRGFGPEPTVNALTLNTLFFSHMCCVADREKVFARSKFLIALYLSALLITMSAAGIISAVIALILILNHSVFKMLHSQKFKLSSMIVVLILMILIFYLSSIEFTTELFGQVVSKGWNYLSGEGYRAQNFTRLVEIFSELGFVEILFGKGVGYLNGHYGLGFNNLYVLIIIEFGSLTALFVIGLYIFIFCSTYLRLRNPYIVGLLIVILLHYTSISGYYFPFIWFSLALVLRLRSEQYD